MLEISRCDRDSKTVPQEVAGRLCDHERKQNSLCGHDVVLADNWGTVNPIE